MTMLVFILLLVTGAPQRALALEHLERGKQLYWTHCTDSIERSFTGVQQTVKELEEAVELDPDLAEAHMYLGRAYHCLAVDYYRLYHHAEGYEEFKTKAIRHAREAVRLAPTSAEAHYVLAGVLDSTKHRDEIISELKKGLALDPDNAEAVWQLGIFLIHKGKVKEGMKLVRKALKSIKVPEILNEKWANLVGLLIDKERYQEAIEVSEAVLARKLGKDGFVEVMREDIEKKIKQLRQMMRKQKQN